MVREEDLRIVASYTDYLAAVLFYARSSSHVAVEVGWVGGEVLVTWNAVEVG
jgi:hypothetical protein